MNKVLELPEILDEIYNFVSPIDAIDFRLVSKAFSRCGRKTLKDSLTTKRAFHSKDYSRNDFENSSFEHCTFLDALSKTPI